jgi:hypothetical protein
MRKPRRTHLAAALLATAALGVGTPVALAQEDSGGSQTNTTTTPTPTPTTTTPSVGFPLLVVPIRNIRMTVAGIAGMTVGCFGNVAEACTGTLRLYLSTPVQAGRTHYSPFYMGGAAFSIVGGQARFVRVRLFPRARVLVRRRGDAPISIAESWNARSGRHGFQRRFTNLYVPPIDQLK